MHAVTPDVVILRHGALDESVLRGGSIILRGVLDPTTLRYLKTDDYQRETAPLTSLLRLSNAIKAGEVMPDIELGMRGDRVKSSGDVYRLSDEVYIIDGLQRVSAALHLLGTIPEAVVNIGATVHFGTNKEWESERFRVLNTLRSPVSPNVLLRNEREKSPVLHTLHDLCTNQKSSPLFERVSWSQRMQRGELITALTLVKITGRLHYHKGALRSVKSADLAQGLERMAGQVGLAIVRDNINTFFNLLDECWGIRHIKYRETAVHLKGTFLYVLADVLSNHTDFWQGAGQNRLHINADLRRKINSFPMADPEISRLSGSGGKAHELLYTLLRDHINSGKRANRLKLRDPASLEPVVMKGAPLAAV